MSPTPYAEQAVYAEKTRQEKMQEKAASVLNRSVSIGGGILGGCATAPAPDYAYKSSIRERVDLALQDAYRANERANVAAEIGFLLDKNPELGRLLDLLDRF